MWFYRQAQSVTQPPQRVVVEEVQPTPTEVITERFNEVVQPLEQKLEQAAEQKTEELLDKNGWWIDESVI